MQDSHIINATKYISFNIHSQAIIHSLNVEQIIEQNLILLALKKLRVFPIFFLKGRQIKNFKLLLLLLLLL